MEDNRYKKEDDLFYGCFYLMIWMTLKQGSQGRMPTAPEWSSDPGGGQEVAKRIKTIREVKRAKGTPVFLSKATLSGPMNYLMRKLTNLPLRALGSTSVHDPDSKRYVGWWTGPPSHPRVCHRNNPRVTEILPI